MVAREHHWSNDGTRGGRAARSEIVDAPDAWAATARRRGATGWRRHHPPRGGCSVKPKMSSTGDSGGGALPVSPFDFLAIFAAFWLAARLFRVLCRRLDKPKLE